MKKMTALIIMDGFGYSTKADNNAIAIEGAPHIHALAEKYPSGLIGASGLSVGLPDGQMGNSEVGHLNIGAGRVVYQELTRITKAIADGDFFDNEAFAGAVENCKQHGSSLHLFGLLSDGGVHSHQQHLYALVKLAHDSGLEKVYAHCFMDGRDTPPESGKGYIEQLQAKLKEMGCGKIATVMGRYYAMDRDNRWDRVEKAYRAMTLGEGLTCPDAAVAMQESYDRGETDEFVLPTVITTGGQPTAVIAANDSCIFFNFRPDRAREISRTFIQRDFDKFERPNGYFPLYYVCFTEYDAEFLTMESAHIAFHPNELKHTLGEYLSECGKTQLRIAETEKYAHVTFFFNGGVEEPNPGEDRCLIPSPKVATYDLQPEMSAYLVADEAVKRINSGKYDAMILNFANCDMVGHTGVLEAAEAAVKAVDECVDQVVSAILAAGGECVITADHGNAEQMYDECEHCPFTAHSTNPVPVIVVGERFIGKSVRDCGVLADLSPTLLYMMGLPQPAEMTGKNLISE